MLYFPQHPNVTDRIHREALARMASEVVALSESPETIVKRFAYIARQEQHGDESSEAYALAAHELSRAIERTKPGPTRALLCGCCRGGCQCAQHAADRRAVTCEHHRDPDSVPSDSLVPFADHASMWKAIEGGDARAVAQALGLQP